MRPSQYAVFQFDVETMTLRDFEGQAPGQPLILDSLEEAERYCLERKAALPTLGCRIYDRDGRIVRTFADEQVYADHHGRPAAKKNLIIGVLCLATGAVCVGVDAWLEWRLVFGFIIGVRFLWAGTVKAIDGISGLSAE